MSITNYNSDRRKRAIAMMTKIDRNIEIIKEYEKGKNMGEVGKMYGITRQAVHKIIDKGIEYYEKLRGYLPGNN